jgi:hypothetical protein
MLTGQELEHLNGLRHEDQAAAFLESLGFTVAYRGLNYVHAKRHGPQGLLSLQWFNNGLCTQMWASGAATTLAPGGAVYFAAFPDAVPDRHRRLPWYERARRIWYSVFEEEEEDE